METIYEIIQENPHYYVWIFGIVNVLWGSFLYFNSQRHNRDLEHLRDSLSIESERRKRVFELKANQYEAYISLLDGLGRNHHDALSQKFVPILQEFLSDKLDVNGSKEQEKQNLENFSEKILQLSQDSIQDQMHVKHESSRLKLTATSEMMVIFEELETLIKASMDQFHSLMDNFVPLLMSGNDVEMNMKQQILGEIGIKIEDARDRLIKCMRSELKNI